MEEESDGTLSVVFGPDFSRDRQVENARVRTAQDVGRVGVVNGAHEGRTSKSLDPAFEPFDFSTADSMVVKNAEDGGGGVASGFSSGGAVMRTDPYDERASCRLACLVTSRETSSFEGLVLDTTCLEDASNDHRTNGGAPELFRKHLIEGAIGGLVSDLEPFHSRGRHREGDFVEVGAVVEKRDVLVVGAETNLIIVPLKLADDS